MKDIISLRPDRDLINPDFTGYSVSFENIPIHEKRLDIDVQHVRSSDDQFSFGHVQIFSFHNYLVTNPYNSEFLYFVDKCRNINQVSLGHMNRVHSIIPVCEIPKPTGQKPNRFPVTIAFASEDRVVITDGVDSFHVALVKKDKWVIIHSDSLPQEAIILSALQTEDKLSILTRSIVEQSFESVLHYITLDQHWKTSSIKKISVPGTFKYASSEGKDTILVINSGPKLPNVIKDSVAIDENQPKYKWFQSPEDITILIDVDGVPENEISVITTENHLKVVIKTEVVIDGEFVDKVSEVTRKIIDGKLEINCVKEVIGVGWSRVIQGDDSGQQFQPDAEESGETPFNSEELEEVDYVPADNVVRIDLESDAISHQVDNAQYLFSVPTVPEKPPAVALRLQRDPDSCIWQFETTNGIWKNKHIETFSAFGYVLAGKPETKFVVAPPNMSYVVLAYAYRYLFLFRQPSTVEGELRNRKSGRRVNTVSKQQVINLQTEEEILGFRATINNIFILTETKLFNLVVNN